eukprot:6226318-Lingulodinium_polyedra.AAC.1
MPTGLFFKLTPWSFDNIMNEGTVHGHPGRRVHEVLHSRLQECGYTFDELADRDGRFKCAVSAPAIHCMAIALGRW